jgi:uncharacterized protein YegP (UPF0339 family)
MHLEVVKGESGQWHINLVGANGETMMSSETYASKGNAIRAAYNIQNNWVSPVEVLVDERA